MTTSDVIAAPGLANLIAAETRIGDVLGADGFFHYRGYDATQLARRCSFEEVWHLLLRHELPDAGQAQQWRNTIASAAVEDDDLTARLLEVVRAATVAGGVADPLATLRTALSAYGTLSGDQPLWDSDQPTREVRAIRTATAVPWLVTAAHAIAAGAQPRLPRPDLGYVANYLWMLTGRVPADEHIRALSRYLVLTVDHGFNNSTFTARCVASTGADLTSCVVAGIGALSGPLHGGAPSRALDALDRIGSVDRAEAWARDQLAAGRRVMGFGHAVYRTLDPRSELLKQTAAELGGPLAELAIGCEAQVVAVLDEAKPDRPLRANVEYYAGVVMQACGIPREMFTPTFAVSRVVGWTAHILEQGLDRKIIRPRSRYVGEPAPRLLPDQSVR
ncbi:citrate/2-methylcitrate synthase [Rudaeicoccus suwonensis]|uniref:Citrate synthase n=1 Tax=Rudaeicoccus suwonensis TaxID=657409 RepID=A0A561EBW2_9MICO|nr:citrate/2-methylcitrate synthase [Rudaeicoccus suwonensis]TWE13095.1 citrate synthase [Rudaeicoccus suwonensis]